MTDVFWRRWAAAFLGCSLLPGYLFAGTNFSAWALPDAGGRIIRKPDALGNRVLDYSGVGYKGGTVPLPATVPVKATISPVAGDNVANIQNALNQVSALPLDASGFRGAVLLTAGEYPLATGIRISASGVVLRGVGSGTNGTILRATGTNQYTLVTIAGSGSASTVGGTTHNITSYYVPVGARGFAVDSTSGLAVGDHVFVRRIATSDWIHDLGMDLLCCPPDVNPWTASGYNIDFDRVLTRIDGNTVFVDAPITTAIDAHYTNGTIRKFTWSGRINNSGIEHIRGVSDYASATDESHAWTFVHFGTIENAWARDVVSQYFGYSCVSLGGGAKGVTVRDCQSLDPVSVITGGRRYAFVMDDCTLCLVQNCYTELDRHQFVTQSLTTGPNVFVDGVSDLAQSDAGPHHRWGSGAIWDNITVNGNNLNVQNRGNLGSGHGWAGANEVVWNCDADGGFVLQNPPGCQNWLIGSIGPIENGTVYVGPHDPGTYDSHGSNVFPNSLYYAQLQDRMEAPNLKMFDYWLGDVDGFTNASGGITVPVDSAWRTAVQAAGGSEPLDGFDTIAAGHWVPFTFNFALSSSERVIGATMIFSMAAAGSAATDDVLYLDSLATALPFSTLGWLPVSTNRAAPSIRVLDLSDRLSLLGDGKLNVAIQDEVGIDWAMLELRIAPAINAITNTIMASADAFVRGGAYAANNYGNSPVLTIKEDSSADNDRKAYLHWDLNGLPQSLSHAFVRLTPVNVGTNGVEHGVTVAAGKEWTETGVTWNTQPGGGKRFATWIPGAGTPSEVVVTPHLLDALASDSQLSLELFAMRNFGAAGNVDYASREDSVPARRPQLVLVYDGVKWSGATSAVWNTNTVNWLIVGSGNATTYHETAVPGDAVLLDDSATGPTVILVTNTVYPASITVDNSTKAYSFSGGGRFSAGMITKRGSNILTFGNSGSNSFAGGIALESGTIWLNTVASAGIVAFNTAPGSQAVLGSSGATLVVTAITAGAGDDSVALNNSSLLLSGAAGSAATPLDALSVTNSSLTLAASTASPAINVMSLITGGSNVINISSITGITGYPARIPLIEYTGTIAAADNFSLGSLPSGAAGYLTNNVANASIELVVLSAVDPGPPKWGGTVNGTWDTTTLNWRGRLSGLPIAYQDGDAVLFDDSAPGTTAVSLGGTLSPGSVTVINAALTYAFSGTGALGGTGALTKNGSGTLVLGNTGANTFSGGVLINGGTLQFSGANNRLPTATSVVLSNTTGAKLDLDGFSQTIGELWGGGASGGNVSLGSGTLTVSGGASSSYNGVLSGSGGLAVSGASTLLQLSGANTYSGSTSISDGALRISNASALGGPTAGTSIGNTAAARLELTGNISVGEPITISCKGSALNGPPAIINVSGTNTLSGLIKGTTGGSDWTFQCDSGRLIVSGDFTNIATVNTRNVKLRGDADGVFSGDIANGMGSDTAVWKDGASTWVLTGNNSYAGPTTITAGTVQIGAGGTTGTLGTGAVINNGALIFNRSDTLEVANVVSGAGSVQKSGSGTLSLTGSDSYSGPTTVNSGLLLAENATGSATGSGTVSVSTGGALGGNGTVAGAVAVNGGAIAPGTGVGGLRTGPLTFASGSRYVWEIATGTGIAGIDWDLLQVNGSLSFLAGSTTRLALVSVGLTNFNCNTNWQWTIASSSGGVGNFSSGRLSLDSSLFTNNLSGGSFSVSTNSSGLLLSFANNHPPLAGLATYSRLAGAALQIPIAELLANATSDPDGDPRALVSVFGSTNGAALTISNDFIVYTPTNAVADRFSYTVRDVRTNPPGVYRPSDTILMATGTILVPVVTDPQFRMISILSPGLGTNLLHFAGLANQPYLVEFATSLAAPVTWLDLLTTNAGSNGRITILDTHATNRQRFYRVLALP